MKLQEKQKEQKAKDMVDTECTFSPRLSVRNKSFVKVASRVMDVTRSASQNSLY